ncbi:glutaredoxin family protein [Nakamurella sp.]|uniref:glutaredoxin family protein n=1 Tax=Nakamurella sp. TaxID=1869182 RepID=UPI003B3BD327
MSTVTVYTRAGCHLCEVAIATASRIAAETGSVVTTVDVDADPEDQAEYGDLVPVILVDGRMHGYYQVDPERLRAALATGPAAGP